MGLAKDKHLVPNNGLKLYIRAVIESEAWPMHRHASKEETIAIKRDRQADCRMISMMHSIFFKITIDYLFK